MFKLTEKSKIYIWGTSPDVFAGGAEVINMLAAHLKERGVDAKCLIGIWKCIISPITLRNDMM